MEKTFFPEGDQMLGLVESFKYLGRMLGSLDGNWSTLRANIEKVRELW